MENDSVNSVAFPDSLGTDSAAVEPVQIGISVRTDSLLNVFKGDTFEFKVNVSWRAKAHSDAILILPVGSANAKGVTQIGVREEHSRQMQGETSISNTQFIYTLTADEAGDVAIPALRFQVPSANGPFEFQTERVAFQIKEPSHTGIAGALGILSAVVVLGGLWMLRRRMNRAKECLAKKRSKERAISEEFHALGKRVTKSDCRSWLLDLEKICKSWAKNQFGNDNLEALAKAGKIKGWDSLIENFAHARYGGGGQDAFEIKETWKLAAKLLNIQEDV